MSKQVTRSFFFTYEESTGKLLINIEHKNAERNNCDESYYGLLYAMTSFINAHSNDLEFTIGAEYLDKQVYLALLEAENLIIVISHSLTKEKASELADEFIGYFESGFNMTVNNLLLSKYIKEEDVEFIRSKKMIIQKQF